MSSRLSVLLVLSMVVFLPACVQMPTKVALNTQSYEKIGNVDHVVIIPQNNLNVTVSTSNSGNTGLLGALIVMAIDSARQSSAEEEAAPIMKKLESYDFRSVFAKKMTDANKMLKKPLLNGNVKVSKIDTDDQMRISYQKSAASAVLFSKVNYKLQTGNLTVSVVSEIYPKADNLLPYRHNASVESQLDDGNVIYRQFFEFNKQAVTENNIVASLNEGADSIVQQMIDNLNNPVPMRVINQAKKAGLAKQEEQKYGEDLFN